MCNNCVVGFDHHCTLLNNCIGKRNLRAFNALLLSSWIFFAVSGAIGMISLLDEPVIAKLKKDEEMKWKYDIIASIILTSI